MGVLKIQILPKIFVPKCFIFCLCNFTKKYFWLAFEIILNQWPAADLNFLNCKVKVKKSRRGAKTPHPPPLYINLHCPPLIKIILLRFFPYRGGGGCYVVIKWFLYIKGGGELLIEKLIKVSYMKN